MMTLPSRHVPTIHTAGEEDSGESAPAVKYFGQEATLIFNWSEPSLTTLNFKGKRICNCPELGSRDLDIDER